MAYEQHQSNYNAFWGIRKTFDNPGAPENSSKVHFFSKQSVPGLTTETRYYKNRNGEYLPLTGTFLDSIQNEYITGIQIQAEKELDNGAVIPEQIVVDFTCPTPGKVDRVQMSSDSKWGVDFAKKIVLVNTEEPISIKPFSFVPDGQDRRNEGFTLYQNDNKILSKYEKRDADGNKVKDKNGFPVNINGVEQFDELAQKARDEKNEKLRKSAWTAYFTATNVFVLDEMMKFVGESTFIVPEPTVPKATNEDDIAF